MKKIYFVLTIIFLFLTSLWAEEICLIYCEGDVRLKNPGQEWVQVTSSSTAENGSLIEVEDNSFSQVNIGTNTEVDVNESSVFCVRKDDDKITLDIIYGSLKAKVKKAPANSMEIRTPVSVAAVRGTEFAVTYEDEDVAEIDVFEGRVNVADASGKEEKSVTSDKWVKVERNQKPEIAGKITQARKLRWEHLKNRKEIFMGLRRLRRIKAEKIRLKRKIKLEKDKSRKKQMAERLKDISSKEKDILKNISEKKKIVSALKKKYKKIREAKAEKRRQLINKKRKEIIRIRLDKRKELLKQRRKRR